MTYTSVPGSPVIVPGTITSKPSTIGGSPSSYTPVPVGFVIVPPEQLLGAALLGSWYSHLGYNSGTNAWADQSGNGLNLGGNGALSVTANASGSFPGIEYTVATTYHGSAAPAAMVAGSKHTVIGLMRRNAAAEPRGFIYSIGGGVFVRSATSTAQIITNADNQQAKQSTPGAGYIDSRQDRFHLIEFSGDLGTWYDGQRLNSRTAGVSYTGITANEQSFGLGKNPTPVGMQSTVLFWLLIKGDVSVTDRKRLVRWVDATYGTDMYVRSKWLCYAGQSNALALPEPTNKPRNSRFYKNATGGTSLVAAPAHWGPTDPNGYRAAIIAEWNENGPYNRSVMVWDQGENDIAGHIGTAAYLAGLEELYSYFSGLITGFMMVVVRMPSWNASGTGADVTNIRAAQASFVANHPTTTILVDSDDITHNVDNVHYDSAGLAVLAARCITAVETLTGDTDWLG